MELDDPLPTPQLARLGHVVLQSLPVTEEEGKVWLNMIAKTLPSEFFTHFSWLPMQPGDPN